MNKSLSRALLAAGVVAFAAAAQAGPMAMTGSGETSMTPTTRGDGQDHSYVYSTPSTPDLTTMGAGPDSSTSYYVYPRSHLFQDRGGASATSNVPDRAGEISTITNGVPNMSTNNYSAPVVDAVIVPYTSTNNY